MGDGHRGRKRVEKARVMERKEEEGGGEGKMERWGKERTVQ